MACFQVEPGFWSLCHYNLNNNSDENYVSKLNQYLQKHVFDGYNFELSSPRFTQTYGSSGPSHEPSHAW